jgi:hypothetical protein
LLFCMPGPGWKKFGIQLEDEYCDKSDNLFL